MGHTITVRGLEDELHAKLKEQARDHHRSMEAEARAILAAGVAGAPVDLSWAEPKAQDWIDRARSAVAAAWSDWDDDWVPARRSSPSRGVPSLDR
ncbi:FitA-like ribbon-helix-helix domain-containing protein [Isoptericola aurantiacus]|uniref:FitA-like ribbon-helix-helix domain-containing protein n=1 Tax=Isoptericola aurantiacus TaxID=3377839 RepID=UPI00383BDB16